ncbi:predicted protein, partial [Naegleria gruberi]
MPCDTNNDASDTVASAPASFMYEEITCNELLLLHSYNSQIKKWIKTDAHENTHEFYMEREDSDDEDDDEDYVEDNQVDDDEEKVDNEKNLFERRMIFNSVRGRTTELGYLDPCDDYHIREYNDDWGRVEEVEEINIGLFYTHLSNENFVEEREKFTYEWKDNILCFRIMPYDFDSLGKYDMMKVI